MIVYFIRHGESELNAKQIHQDKSVKLTAKGIQQAHNVADRFIDVPIDVILSSPFVRAKQTADIISEKLNIPVELNPLLSEIKRPTEIEGKHINDPQVVRIKNVIRKNWENPEFRYSDEENFHELKSRAKKIINELSKLNKDHVLVVTHGYMIGITLSFLTFGDDLRSREVFSIRKLFSLSNTGVTVFKFEDNNWKLITWNDVTHLPK